MWLISALSFCDSVKYIYLCCQPTSMFFVATTSRTGGTHYMAYAQSHIDTLHGLLFGVMDDYGVKTCIGTFNRCAPSRKHSIIRSFK